MEEAVDRDLAALEQQGFSPLPGASWEPDQESLPRGRYLLTFWALAPGREDLALEVVWRPDGQRTSQWHRCPF